MQYREIGQSSQEQVQVRVFSYILYFIPVGRQLVSILTS